MTAAVRVGTKSVVFGRQKDEITVIAGMVHYMGHRSAKYSGKHFLQETNQDGVQVFRCHVSESYNNSFLGAIVGVFFFHFFVLGGWHASQKANMTSLW